MHKTFESTSKAMADREKRWKTNIENLGENIQNLKIFRKKAGD